MFKRLHIGAWPYIGAMAADFVILLFLDVYGVAYAVGLTDYPPERMLVLAATYLTTTASGYLILRRRWEQAEHGE